MLITHYMDEAVQADRVVVMDDGGDPAGRHPAGGVLPTVEIAAAPLGPGRAPGHGELLYRLPPQGIKLPRDAAGAWRNV